MSGGRVHLHEPIPMEPDPTRGVEIVSDIGSEVLSEGDVEGDGHSEGVVLLSEVSWRRASQTCGLTPWLRWQRPASRV